MSTAERILDAAEEFIMTRGYNGFSYKDIAPLLGIKTASIHYHFPKKEVLGVRVVQRYAERYEEALEALDASYLPAAAKLDRYLAGFYGIIAKGPRVCLCAAIAAELGTVGEPLRAEIDSFFSFHEAWLARNLDDARRSGDLEFGGSAEDRATLMFSALEGALIVSRGRRDLDTFKRVIASLRAELTSMQSTDA